MPRLSTLRPLLLALTVTVLVPGLAAPAAEAKPAKKTLKKAMWGPAFKGGKSQFPIYRDLGVGIWQTGLFWADVAATRPADPTNPNDPAYTWPAELDDGYREAQRYGIKVLLLVMRTPSWANGGRDDRNPPTKASDYADFMEAASKRYPAVRHWMVWGEPHRAPNFEFPLTPGDRDPRKGLDRAQRAVVSRYAGLVDATYVRLKKRSKRNLIIGGNTTTSGDLTPFDWIKNLKLRNGKPPRMDMVGHNPFGTRKPDLRKKPLKYGTADFSDLDTYKGWTDRFLRRSGRNKRLKIFISEYNAPTRSGFEFNYFVTPRTQASWARAALTITRSRPWIATLGWQSLYDIGPVGANKFSYTGLISLDGKKKPGYTAFKRG